MLLLIIITNTDYEVIKWYKEDFQNKGRLYTI